jgi:hypothetical protein
MYKFVQNKAVKTFQPVFDVPPPPYEASQAAREGIHPRSRTADLDNAASLRIRNASLQRCSGCLQTSRLHSGL